MNLNFRHTKRLQANIQNAFDMFKSIGYWLKAKKKYKKDNSGQWIEDGKQLAFNESTNQSISEYLLGILWRLSFPIIFHCADEEIHEVIEERYGSYSDSYKKLLLDVAREHNPQIENIEQEFIENLSDYNPDSINSLINIYRVQWKGYIPNITTQFGYFDGAYKNKEHPLYEALHEAETNNLLDFGEIYLILGRLDWITQTLKSIGESINKLFERWEESTQIKGKNSSSDYTISEERKTDFIKIISAMYDCRIFSNVNGMLASNKKQLIKELGKFFNTEIDDYSPLLSAAKRNSNYLEIFDNLKEKGETYFNK